MGHPLDSGPVVMVMQPATYQQWHVYQCRTKHLNGIVDYMKKTAEAHLAEVTVARRGTKSRPTWLILTHIRSTGIDPAFKEAPNNPIKYRIYVEINLTWNRHCIDRSRGSSISWVWRPTIMHRIPSADTTRAVLCYGLNPVYARLIATPIDLPSKIDGTKPLPIFLQPTRKHTAISNHVHRLRDRLK